MIIPNPGEQIELNGVGTPQQVQDAMCELIAALKNDSDVNEIAGEIMKTTAPEKWGDMAALIAYNMAFFEPDPPGKQMLRTVRRTIQDRRANCVDYTLFIGAICHALGLPVTVRIVQFDGAPNYGHVFPIVDGKILDVVPGQDQNGNEWRQRIATSRPKLGTTAPYLRHTDKAVR